MNSFVYIILIVHVVCDSFNFLSFFADNFFQILILFASETFQFGVLAYVYNG